MALALPRPCRTDHVMPFRLPMSAARRLAPSLLVCAAALWGATASLAEQPAPEPGPSAAYLAAQLRWKSSLDAFAAADRTRMPESGGVLFFGSSSIRMWSRLAQDFSELPVVINRGFGGSTMAECSVLARDLVVRYRPRHVLVYAGDNDLMLGRTPIQVLEAFAQFAHTVREALPDTRISYISIKPSPSRERLLPQIREANHIIAAYVRTQADADFIDIYTPMMGEDGRPRAELFLPDRLHMNQAGYRLWHDAITAHLQADEDDDPPAVTTTADAVPR